MSRSTQTNLFPVPKPSLTPAIPFKTILKQLHSRLRIRIWPKLKQREATFPKKVHLKTVILTQAFRSTYPFSMFISLTVLLMADVDTVPFLWQAPNVTKRHAQVVYC